MIRFLTFLMTLISFLIFLRMYWAWYRSQSRRRAHYSQKDRLTLFDVKELLRKGEKELAIEVYRQIFDSNRAESEKAIDELEKGMKK